MKKPAGTCSAALVAVGMVAGMAGSAYAGGFALLEQSARSLGRAHSGGAALVDDASAVFYNPAGLTQLDEQQFMGSLSYIDLQADFTKKVAVDAAGRPLSGPESGGARKSGYVPAIFFATPINDRLATGIGLYVPFGLNTDYPADSIARYQAIYSSVAALNLTPSVAYRINDVYSVGLGVTAQYFSVKLTNDIDYGAVCYGSLDPATCQGFGLMPQSHDGYFGVKGHDTAYGFDIGILADYGTTQIGFTYRSSIKHDLNGEARFEAVPAVFAAQGLFQNGPVQARIQTPEQASLSFAHELDDRWTISGDVTWMGWDRFDAIEIHFKNPKQPTTVQPENWRNTWRASVGTDWHYNDAWTLRGGLAWDQTPIKNRFRTARLPGNTREWLSLGATWHLGGLDLDIGYAHLFVGNHISIDQSSQSHDRLAGDYKVATDIWAIGVRHGF